MACQGQPMATSEPFFSKSPNIEEIDTKIKSLKHQITVIQGEIRRLEEYKNTQLLTVAKLPPDVLSIILESLALDAPPSSISGREACAHILPATHVCRLWRQVALNSPRVWGCINGFASLPIIKMFLERSKSAPLCLWNPTTYTRNVSQKVLAVCNHLNRVRKIILRCNPEWAKQIISAPTPQLEILSLRSNSSDNTTDLFVISADTFPSLQHLSLIGYIFKASIGSLNNIRSLLITPSDHGGWRRSKINHADPLEFFAMLSGLPFLSSLTLIDALAPLKGPIPLLSVALPSLTHLLIQDDEISNLGMMSCITAPLIEVKLWHTGEANAGTAYPAIAAIYSNLPDIPHSHSKFTLCTAANGRHPSWFGAHVQIWTGCPVEKREAVIPFFDLKVSGTGDLGAEGWAFTLCPTTTLPPTLHFRSDVESHNYDSLAPYREHIFRQLKAVTELHSDRLIDISLILCDTPSDPSEAMSLPSLRKIITNIPDIKYKQRVLSRLRKQLGARKAVDAGIEIWQIDRRRLSPSDLEQFAGMVNIAEVPTPATPPEKPTSILNQPQMW
ncbi:hypothetical protein EYR40_001533 [Pleurotus pulmonarius]|nr:hypothetical protein EYR38_004776 [Pleurotus pulmonarius]KAF4609180.1 hypothetical protein EYR40_001533 [Pleurotus pulmonarius]